MKKLLTILLFSPALSFAQLHMEIGYGATRSTFQEPEKETHSRILPVYKFAIGYEVNSLVFEASVQPTPMPTFKNSPNFIGVKAGYNFNGLVPTIGYYYNLANSDLPEYNTSNVGIGLKYQYQVNDNGGLYIEGLAAGKNYQLTAGIHYQF